MYSITTDILMEAIPKATRKSVKGSADVAYGLRADIITGSCFVEYLFDEYTYHKCTTEYRQFKPRHKVGYCFC